MSIDNEQDDKIVQMIKKSPGYWRIVIRPAIFDRHHIPDLTQSRSLVYENQVRLLGRSYPYFREGEIKGGNEWIEFSYQSNGDGKSEFWRLYQSAQFIHMFTFREDTVSQQPYNGAPWLHPINTLYIFTEIFVFTSRLIEENIYRDQVEIFIELQGTQDRLLADPTWDFTMEEYVCRMPNVNYSIALESTEVLANYNELALNGMSYVFERFNMHPVPVDILRERQRKFLGGRL